MITPHTSDFQLFTSFGVLKNPRVFEKYPRFKVCKIPVEKNTRGLRFAKYPHKKIPAVYGLQIPAGIWQYPREIPAGNTRMRPLARSD